MSSEKLWDDWEIVSQIGQGAFGKVYKIERKEFGYVYQAALKIIEIPGNQAEVDYVKNEGMDEESVTEYFRSIVEEIICEFRLMSKLKGNTNIVSYEDHKVVENEDRFGWKIYIRMELLTPLYDYLKKNTFSIRDVISMGVDICKALEVCQKYNIIHRDIKPENIFVSDIGYYKLGDFGIARQLEKTSSGLSKKGTYSYMAPEVYKGMAYNSTVDIYSLGIVLYRFLNNNRLPFMPMHPKQIRYSDIENANLLRMSGKPLDPPCNSKGRLNEIILKACAYDPKERYENPGDMRRALEHILYTESEAEIIYPHGDVLINDQNEYLKENQENPQNNTEEETIYLFREKSQKNKNIGREIKDYKQRSDEIRDNSEKTQKKKIEYFEEKQNVKFKRLGVIVTICIVVLATVFLWKNSFLFNKDKGETDNEAILADEHKLVETETKHSEEENAIEEKELIISPEAVLGVWEGSYIGMSNNQKKEKKIRLYIGKYDKQKQEQNIQGVAEIEEGEAGYYYWEGNIKFEDGSFVFGREKWLSDNPDHLNKLTFSTVYNTETERFEGVIVTDPERTIQFSKAENDEFLEGYWNNREELIGQYN